MKKTVIFICSTLFFQNAFAWHLIGAECAYEHLGGDTFKIKLRVYRDCSNPIAAPFDDPAYVAIFSGDSTLYSNQPLFLTWDSLLENYECSPFPYDNCTQTTEYNFIIPLPFSEHGYFLVYQRCCRNSIITNLDQPSNTGMTTWIKISSEALLAGNNSPMFKFFPSPIICLNQTYTFDHSAFDADGDSLSYSLQAPFQGGSPALPQPNPAAPPPYALVSYLSPYTYQQPLGSPSPVYIDSLTGMLEVTPTTLSVYLVGVEVREYRNGVLLSSHLREFEFMVTQFSVGINEAEINDAMFVLSPNPAFAQLEISYPENYQAERLKIMNALGQTMKEEKDFSTQTVIDISDLPKGFYFLELQNEKGKAIKKFVKD